jgi:thiol-disulfide isomerase/thioredoxin
MRLHGASPLDRGPRGMKSLYFVASVVSLTFASSLPAQDLGIAVGQQAPASVVVEALDGKSVDLARFIGKTPVLIQFWATWCPSCRALEPSFRAAQAKYGARVKFIGVAVSVNQSPERVRLYREKHGMTHDIFYDRKGFATDAFEVPATSYIVVLDRKGKVVYTGLGADQNIEAAVRKAF